MKKIVAYNSTDRKGSTYKIISATFIAELNGKTGRL